MDRLDLTTFGGVDIRLDGRPIKVLSAHKSQALLIYLAHNRQKHSRQALAGLLWSEMPEESARRNLRVALTRIRPKVGNHLVIKRRSLAIDRESHYWLDVDEFDECLSPANPTLEQLEKAADLYKGEFLSDFFLRDAPLWEEWVRPLQERYRQMAMEALYRLANYYTNQRQYNTAIDFSNRLLELELWREDAHRQLMLLYALNGQRSAALAQYKSCREILFEELGVDPAKETTILYQQILNDEIEPVSPLVTIPVETGKPVLFAPVQIPAGSTHFVGRSVLISDLSRELNAEKGNKLQALVGMGGVGKTSLAIELAQAVKEDFPDGVLWANAATSEPMAVLESWAAAYGYDFERISDLDSIAAAFRGVLADKKALIVLDDVTSISRIRPLLPGDSDSRVMITTRDQDTARALDAETWPVNELSPENGRLLLASILGDERIAAEPDAADTICTILHNLPLAVEITAQRLKSRPRRRLADMAQRLRDETRRLSLLKISDQAVRASFQISWETLDAEHRRVFSLLGVFGGRSFSANALADIAKLNKYQAEDRLFTLTALSLVKEDENYRYRQHPLLADFSVEKLENVPDPYIDMARYFQEYARNHGQDYDALRPEWDNLSAGLETAFRFKLWPLIVDYAEALTNAWFARGRYHEASNGYQLAYKAADAIEDRKSKSNFLYQWAHALVEQSRYDEARELLLQYLDLFDRSENEAGTADVYYELARISLERSDFDKARQYLIDSKRIRESIGNKVGVAETIDGQAWLLYDQGEFQEALKLGKEALNIYEEADYKLGVIETLRTIVNSILGMYRRGLGHPDDLASAKSYCERALHLAELLKEKGEMAVTLYVLSRVYLVQNEFKVAEETGKQSLKILETIGDQRSQAIVLGHIGEVYSYQDNFETALDFTNQSLKIFQKLGARTDVTVALSNIALWHKSLGHDKRAQKYWTEALEMAKALGHTNLASRIQKRLDAL
jgi:DNA-binding SARP family transcriptional activator/predicted ATPase